MINPKTIAPKMLIKEPDAEMVESVDFRIDSNIISPPYLIIYVYFTIKQ
jgi:hypothetical protein